MEPFTLLTSVKDPLSVELYAYVKRDASEYSYAVVHAKATLVELLLEIAKADSNGEGDATGDCYYYVAHVKDDTLEIIVSTCSVNPNADIAQIQANASLMHDLLELNAEGL